MAKRKSKTRPDYLVFTLKEFYAAVAEIRRLFDVPDDDPIVIDIEAAIEYNGRFANRSGR